MKITKCFFLLAFLGIGLLSFAGPNEDLLTACKQGDLAAARAAIDAGADVNAPDPGGNPAIGYATFWPEIVQLLLDEGADPNGGNYPAIINAGNGYSNEVVKMLLDAGADPNKPGLIDQSATYRQLLEAEKAKGKKKANKALVKAYEDAIANAVPTKVYAATAITMQTNNVAGLKMMIDAGMKLELEDGSNALQTFANYANSREMRKAMFAQSEAGYGNFGIKVPGWLLDLPDDKNGKATDMLEVLLGAGLDMNKKDASGFTPLCALVKGTMLADPKTKQGKIDAAKMLIERGADVNEPSTLANTNWTYYPVCLAAEIGDMELMEALVEHGANLDNTVRSSTMILFSSYASIMENGGTGYTATIVAILAGNNDAANYLVEKGADMTIGVEGFATLESGAEGLKCLTTVKNKSPIYWAVEKRNDELVTAIGNKLAGTRLPEYSVRLWANVGNAVEDDDEEYTIRCAQLKKLTYSPSEHARLVGNEFATEYLEGIGL